MEITEKQWNELQCRLIDIQEKVSKLADASGNELLTPKEVCAKLKISMRTYHRYVDEGLLTPVQLDKGKRVYVKRHEIEQLIAEGRV